MPIPLLIPLYLFGLTLYETAEYINQYNRGKIMNQDFKDWLKVNAVTQKGREAADQPLGFGGQFNIERLIKNRQYMQERADLDAQLARINERELFSPYMRGIVNSLDRQRMQAQSDFDLYRQQKQPTFQAYQPTTAATYQQPQQQSAQNAYGERLDASGNVWDPRTAQRDIYGGQFVQAGTRKWERDERGKLVKVQYGPNNTKQVIAGHRKKSKD